MLQKTSDPPRILRNSAGRSTCSIFRVPHSLKEINPNNYGPHVVSIGPYHHGASHLKMIEEHKWRFLGSLLKRIEVTRSIGLEQLVSAVRAVEESARDCYSSCFDYSADEFAEMLVLDGCFLIEFLRKYNSIIPFERNDPLVSVSWIFSFFLRDFINLENQVPFFILQLLFDLTKNPTTESHVSLSILALTFFNDAFERPEELIRNYQNPAVQHLLDLLRSSFIPIGYEEPTATRFPNTRLIKCISKLRRAGIKFRSNTHDSFLAVTFRHGVIYMGTIALDDFMSSFLHNCVAYEQCRRACSKHMTTYATFLDCLINSGGDVGYLCDKNIIDNYFGTDSHVADFINNLGKDVSFDSGSCYLSELFNQVNDYYHNHWNVHWATFKFIYFDTPWSFISAMAAFVLLALTVVQTFYTVLSYVQ